MTKSAQYLSVREAAIVLGVSTTQVWRLLESGDLHKVDVSHPWGWTQIARKEVTARKAKLAKVSRPTIYAWIKARKIQTEHIAGRLVIVKSSLQGGK